MFLLDSEARYIERKIFDGENETQIDETCSEVLITINKLLENYKSPQYPKNWNGSPAERDWNRLCRRLQHCNNITTEKLRGEV